MARITCRITPLWGHDPRLRGSTYHDGKIHHVDADRAAVLSRPPPSARRPAAARRADPYRAPGPAAARTCAVAGRARLPGPRWRTARAAGPGSARPPSSGPGIRPAAVR